MRDANDMPKEITVQKLDNYAVADLDRRLPRGYAKKAVELLNEKGIHQHDEAYVRHVKSGRFFSPEVLKVLYHIATLEDQKIIQLKEDRDKLDHMPFTPQS